MATLDNAFEFLAPVWSHLTMINPVEAKGIYLYDADGNQYIDFTSGIGVTNTGHCHPRVVKAIQDQAQKLIFGQMNIVVSSPALELAELLNEVTPDGIDTFFFANSGAEAVEAAVKLARQATQRRNIIVFQGSFHGRTAQAMAMTTAKSIYSYDYQPLPSGVYVAPFPYRHYYGWDEETVIDFCLKQLDLLFKTQSPAEKTAALVIEPILGEGGYVPAPDGFIQELRRICDETGVLLVLDEIQSGFGRTGKLFCFEHAGITPDIIIMAKGLASGLPISAIGSRREIMQRWPLGSHGGTYGGGSAVALAAACETVRVIRDEGLAENAAQMGEHLQTRLRALQTKYPTIGEVRGRGLMTATEFTRDGEPDKTTAKAVAKYCIDHKLLLMTCGPYENVIRWIPPLIVTKEQMDGALTIFESALKHVLETA